MASDAPRTVKVVSGRASVRDGSLMARPTRRSPTSMPSTRTPNVIIALSLEGAKPAKTAPAKNAKNNGPGVRLWDLGFLCGLRFLRGLCVPIRPCPHRVARASRHRALAGAATRSRPSRVRGADTAGRCAEAGDRAAAQDRGNQADRRQHRDGASGARRDRCAHRGAGRVGARRAAAAQGAAGQRSTSSVARATSGSCWRPPTSSVSDRPRERSRQSPFWIASGSPRSSRRSTS